MILLAGKRGTPMKIGLKSSWSRIQAVFAEFFGLGRTTVISATLFTLLVVAFAVFWFFYSAPPRTITMTSGPKGSMFQRNAEKYAVILARHGVKLKILDSEGSKENLTRLIDPKFRVDIGFVQGGVADGLNVDKLVSLGSVFHEPLLIFYRRDKPVELLSELKGRRLAIGPDGSGTRSLALLLLKDNGIEPGGTSVLNGQESDEAAKALLVGKLDAVFLMGDSAEVETIRTLMRTPQIHLYSVIQADAYIRRIHYLSKLILPMGSLDFGKNIPHHDIQLIGPTVELIARPELHPALSDLLLEAAREVHGSAGMLRYQGEFPSPIEHEYRISSDALSYYKSGKSFLYRYLPFQLASLMNRIIVIFVPMLVVLIPGLKIIPKLYRWRINLGIYRWYRALLILEKELTRDVTPDKRLELIERLGQIEQAVNVMKVPASFAEQFYVLRGHIDFVHERLIGNVEPAPDCPPAKT
jgi:NMT1-like family